MQVVQIEQWAGQAYSHTGGTEWSVGEGQLGKDEAYLQPHVKRVQFPCHGSATCVSGAERQCILGRAYSSAMLICWFSIAQDIGDRKMKDLQYSAMHGRARVM